MRFADNTNTRQQRAGSNPGHAYQKGAKMGDYEKKVLATSLVASVAAFLIMSLLAYAQRGYYAVGGEIMAFFIPLYTALILGVRASNGRK